MKHKVGTIVTIIGNNMCHGMPIGTKAMIVECGYDFYVVTTITKKSTMWAVNDREIKADLTIPKNIITI